MKCSRWNSVSRNPISKEAQSLVSRRLNEIYRGPIYNLSEFWKSTLSGKSLLDIGVVEHTLELSQREGWRHGLFAKLASRAVGVDILQAEVAQLNEQGYDIRLCDATSDADLGDRFEVVYIGDVIEHVNDPVRLLQFAGRHLLPKGKIVVSTPCPFWWRNIQLMIKDHTFIGNVDHVRWVTPANALEIGGRANVPLLEYRTVETCGNTAFRRFGKSVVNRLLGRNELFTWAYIFTFADIKDAA